MTSPRTVAIVGAGIGATHAAAFRTLNDRYREHTICDLDVELAAGLSADSPGCKISTDLTSVVGNPDIDIIDICLPPHLHYEACSQALAANKHVISEKPLVSSLRDADRLIELCRSSKGSLFPVFQYRFGLGASQLRTLIDSGIAGKPFVGTLETHWNRGADYYAAAWRGTWAGEQGGAVLGHAIHIHDWLSFVFGPIASVYAELATRVNPIEVEDCASLTIRMNSGALVTSSITLGAANDTSRLRFCFEGLTAESGRSPYSPAEDTWTFIAREPVSQSAIDSMLASVEVIHSGYAGLFSAIADALDGQPSQEVTVEDARRSLEFVSAVYASSRTQQAVSLPLNDTYPLYAGWEP